MMLVSLFFSAALLLAPSAQAAEVLNWNFATQGLSAWELSTEAQVSPFADGLLMTTREDTVMLWTLPPSTRLDSLTLHAESDRPTTVTVIWHTAGEAQNVYKQFPIEIDGGTGMKPLRLALADLPGFDDRIDRLGFGLPALSSVYFRSLSLYHTSGGEKLTLWWQSFWTFDTLTMRSINFVWGPRLAGSRAALETLYETEPAGGVSANRLFYGGLMIGLSTAWWLSRTSKRRGATVALATIASCWLAYDLRMSAELLNQALTDGREWALAAPEVRTLRKSEDGFHVLEALPGALGEEKKYALIATDGFSRHFFRYATYPALPVTESDAQLGLRDWVVFHRPDVTVVDNRLINQSGVPITPPGEIVERFSDNSFLFRVTKP